MSGFNGLHDVNEQPITVQNPLSSDGDSIYTKDINLERSDSTGWTGKINDLFNDINTTLENSTTDNPKELLIYFNRTIFSNFIGIGCSDEGGNFSNVKVELLRSGGVSNIILDESSNNTKETSKRIDILDPDGFNAIKFTFSTADTICLANVTIQKAIQTTSRLQARSELDNKVEDITSFRRALNVTNSLVHKVGVNLFFFRNNAATTTLASPVIANNIAITVVDSTGFSEGDKIRVTSTLATGQAFLIITDITGNVITVDRPISVSLPVGSTVDQIFTNMNVLGTLALPQTFRIQPPAGAVWQLTRLIINITDATAMDDGKFGGLPALTNGVNLRIVKGNGEIQDLTNWKTNGDMAIDMFDVNYTDRAPAGDFGLRARWTFTKAEFIVELDGDQGDVLELRVQDNLTGLDSFEIKVQGRLFGG